jgi:3-dehydro-L-gulonate 2-dehydrogenase
MRIPFHEMQSIFADVLSQCHFSPEKAARCASIFASNSLDGVYSHGVLRFPVFIDYVKQGLIRVDADPELIHQNGLIETWDGHSGPGMYNASKAMGRAIELSKANGIGCVAMRNTNHWMRGGTYGWQAAEAGCIGICFTNTIANMPPWGGKDARLGNNPLIIAVPRAEGHLVLDMAMSQFSYGKLQEYEIKNRKLPVFGGYDEAGKLTNDPSSIVASRRALPIGFWKGSGLSFMLDVLLTALTGGRSVSRISESGHESGVSQAFICIHQDSWPAELIEEIIAYTKTSSLANDASAILYPGENTLATRKENELHGIPVDEKIWQSILALR